MEPRPPADDPPALHPPYPGYLDELAEQMERDVANAAPLESAHAGAEPAVHSRLAERVDADAADLVALSHDVHTNPELGYAEQHAVSAVARLLGDRGHDATVGVWDLPTALHARAGEGRPRVAVLAEYDALPGIGHACGHNIICATAVGAFLAVADTIEDLGGSVELIGCPAEEGGGGKEWIARAGGFDEVDAAVMLHPHSFEVAEHPWLGVRQVEVVYRGLSAHASAMPFLGRNALDAAVQAYQSMAALRQHLLPTDRVHGIFTDGGQRPNIVPERAALQFYLRSAAPETLATLTERATAIFEAAAQATGTACELHWDPCPVYLPVRNNHPLSARYAANMSERGRRVLPAGIVPSQLTGSTDLGNVSVRVPAIHPTLQIAPADTTIHNPRFAEWAASERADAGVLDGAYGLAATAADFLADEELRKAVDEDFAAAGGRIEPQELLG